MKTRSVSKKEMELNDNPELEDETRLDPENESGIVEDEPQLDQDEEAELVEDDETEPAQPDINVDERYFDSLKRIKGVSSIADIDFKWLSQATKSFVEDNRDECAKCPRLWRQTNWQDLARGFVHSQSGTIARIFRPKRQDCNPNLHPTWPEHQTTISKIVFCLLKFWAQKYFSGKEKMKRNKNGGQASNAAAPKATKKGVNDTPHSFSKSVSFQGKANVKTKSIAAINQTQPAHGSDETMADDEEYEPQQNIGSITNAPTTPKGLTAASQVSSWHDEYEVEEDDEYSPLQNVGRVAKGASQMNPWLDDYEMDDYEMDGEEAELPKDSGPITDTATTAHGFNATAQGFTATAQGFTAAAEGSTATAQGSTATNQMNHGHNADELDGKEHKPSKDKTTLKNNGVEDKQSETKSNADATAATMPRADYSKYPHLRPFEPTDYLLRVHIYINNIRASTKTVYITPFDSFAQFLGQVRLLTEDPTQRAAIAKTDNFFLSAPGWGSLMSFDIHQDTSEKNWRQCIKVAHETVKPGKPDAGVALKGTFMGDSPEVPLTVSMKELQMNPSPNTHPET